MKQKYSSLATFIKQHYYLRKICANCLSNPVLNNIPLLTYLYKKKIKKAMKIRTENIREVYIETTNLCGADCIMCPHKTMKREKGIMDKKISDKITDEYAEMGGYSVCFNGFGDAFLDPLLFDRIEYASKNKGLKLGLFTNGRNLPVKKIANSSLSEIYISLDAATPETHKKMRPNLDYNEIVESIKELLSYKKRPIVRIAAVETEHNAKEIPLILKQWKGVPKYISLYHNWTLKGNIKAPYKDPCYNLWAGVFVDWQGNAVICCLDYESREVIGDTRTQHLREIWRGKALQSKREEHIRGEYKGLCKNCTYNIRSKGIWWS